MPDRIVLMVVADDPPKAARMLMLMPAACQRGGSGFGDSSGGADRRFVSVVATQDNAKLAALAALTDDAAPLEQLSRMQSGDAPSVHWDAGFRVEWAKPSSNALELGDVLVRLVQSWDFDVSGRKGLVEEHFEEMQAGGGAGRRILLGVTDCQSCAALSIGAATGIAALFADALSWSAAGYELTMGLALTGFEREFSRLDPSPEGRAKLESDFDCEGLANDWAVATGANGLVLRSLIHDCLNERRPDLRHLMEMAHQSSMSEHAALPIVTAVLPCGFHFQAGWLNHDAATGWIEPYADVLAFQRIAPFHCAEPLLAALLNEATPYQATPDEFSPPAAQAPPAGASRAVVSV